MGTKNPLSAAIVIDRQIEHHKAALELARQKFAEACRMAHEANISDQKIADVTTPTRARIQQIRNEHND